MEALLECRDLAKNFGGLAALTGIDLTIGAGEILGVIGPNGAGKTTLFNLIVGTIVPTRGEVLFQGRRLNGQPPDRVCRLGLARTYQSIRLFPGLTAREHLLAGTWFGRDRTRTGRPDREVAELLDCFELTHLANRTPEQLTYREKKYLELARALATRPLLLLLDEPAAGLRPNEVTALAELLARINRRGVTLILIEHVLDLINGLCPRVVGLVDGRVWARGTPREVIGAGLFGGWIAERGDQPD